MSEVTTRKIDAVGAAKRLVEWGKKYRASLPEAERKALEAREKRAAAEILITTSTGNEIKPGK